jgi:glycosyltransferase involved in cell wall biosynthesis
MYIAMVTEYFLPYVQGGVEKYTYWVSGELMKRGHIVEIFTSVSNSHSFRCGNKRQAQLNGVKIHYKDGLSLRQSQLSNFDLVNIQNYSRLLYPFICLRNQKIVLTCHGALLGPSFENKSSGKAIFDDVYDRFLTPFLLKKATKIIALTKSEGEYILDRYSILPSNLTILPTGIPDEAFELVNQDSPRFKDIAEFPFIFSIGRVEKRKRLDHIIQILPSLPNDVHFVFAGQDQGYLSTLMGVSRKLGVINRVHYLGAISDNEKFELLSKSLFFVLSSKWEMQPVVLLEAMAQRKAIICTRVGGNSEFVIPGVNGFLYDYGNIRELERKIKMLLNDKNLRDSMGQRGRNIAWNQYRIDRVVDDTEALYGTVIE